jgi:hypothetical protein
MGFLMILSIIIEPPRVIGNLDIHVSTFVSVYIDLLTLIVSGIAMDDKMDCNVI